jgi:seryl-tRNA synthetase
VRCCCAQSRRLEVRLRTPKVPGSDLNRKEYVHMLNCTLSATERTLCCVLENYQTPEGVRCARCISPSNPFSAVVPPWLHTLQRVPCVMQLPARLMTL